MPPTKEVPALPSHEELRARLYRALLLKLRPLVDKHVVQTVGTLKARVSGEDEAIQEVAKELRPDGYVFERDYSEVARTALVWLRENVHYVFADLPFSYWLSPQDVLEAGVGDDEDLAVTLCALLSALGDEKAKVVITRLSNGRSHAFVLTEINAKTHVLDPGQEHDFDAFTGTTPKALQSYSFQGAGIKRLLFSFNAQEYKNYEDTG